MLSYEFISFRSLSKVVATLVLAGFAAAALGAQSAPAHPLAQELVKKARAQHADVTEIGIQLPTARGCTTIASTDPSDVGETCEAADIKPFESGRAAVVREADAYSVALPLHDAHGHRVGVVGVETKRAGHTHASALREARQIEKSIAAQIPSRSSLEN